MVATQKTHARCVAVHRDLLAHGPLPIAEIRERHNLGARVCDLMMNRLRKLGWVELTNRGPGAAWRALAGVDYDRPTDADLQAEIDAIASRRKTILDFLAARPWSPTAEVAAGCRLRLDDVLQALTAMIVAKQVRSCVDFSGDGPVVHWAPIDAVPRGAVR